jgi:hypothetical protein
MNEADAKKLLRKLLRQFTPGSILHLLSDLFREDAEKAAAYEDSMAYERCKSVECTFYVVGLGIDAACPR